MELLPTKTFMFLSQAQQTVVLFAAPGIAAFSVLAIYRHSQGKRGFDVL